MALSGGAGRAGEQLSALSDYVRQPENRKQVIGGAILLAVLLAILTSNSISNGIGSVFERELAGPQLTAEGLPYFTAYEDVFVSDAIAYHVIGPANVRAFPTSQDTEVLFSLAEGTLASASEVKAFDPSSRWLKLADGQYVWGRNLEPFEIIADGNVAAIPDFLHGTWSSMDTCRGFDANHEIVIEADGFRYSGMTGRLESISADDRGKPIYNFAMSDEEWSWFESYSITVNEGAMTLFFDSLVNHERGFRPFHRPEIDCTAAVFE
ncbi:hypothetical protein [Erythrobacter sp. MTPC3]|uniref:hypothetical protein n=1 Tax=Erythrobacter sp. MTPC3 TaxID=3056564 RepID=UPI0036F1B32A